MTTLVINAGSSSIKFALFEGSRLTVKAKGRIERIGSEGTKLIAQIENRASINRPCLSQNPQTAIKLIGDLLLNHTLGDEEGILDYPDDITSIGHRVVHGGEKINHPVWINPDVKKIIQEFSILAPIHNPPALSCIEACEKLFPNARQAAVFDTAFHTTLPEHAYLYGLPYKYYKKDKIRKYGFHGINHKYVCTRASQILNHPLTTLKIISCHLGNGSSITAVENGKSIETTMGFTPMEGLIMGTRCGNIDPGILFYLNEIKGMSMPDIKHLLNQKSGLLGMADIGSSDIRDITNAEFKGNHQAQTAIKAFVHRIRKIIGAYAAILSGLDVLIFTGGIGENVDKIRKQICHGFNGNNTANIKLDPSKSDNFNQPDTIISTPNSPVKVLIITANEEKEIALQVQKLDDSI